MLLNVLQEALIIDIGERKSGGASKILQSERRVFSRQRETSSPIS